MLAECHGHIFMNGMNYLDAVKMHRGHVCEEVVRGYLEDYQSLGITYFRDGGDSYGVSQWAMHVAEEYGIQYRTPVFAIYKRGHYGGIVGRDFDDMKGYHELVREVRRLGGHFIKIMISGIVDFSKMDVITGEPLDQIEVKEMINIAHEEGFSVMVHANGDVAVRNALLGGADSIEHGYFMDEECIALMAETNVVWVPTLVPVGNLIGKGRYSDENLKNVLLRQKDNVLRAYRESVSLAVGSDAGAYGVIHGVATLEEYHAMRGIDRTTGEIEGYLEAGAQKIMDKF